MLTLSPLSSALAMVDPDRRSNISLVLVSTRCEELSIEDPDMRSNGSVLPMEDPDMEQHPVLVDATHGGSRHGTTHGESTCRAEPPRATALAVAAVATPWSGCCCRRLSRMRFGGGKSEARDAVSDDVVYGAL